MLWSPRIGRLYVGPGVDVAALPTHLADKLRQASASTVEVQGHRVKFTAGMFRPVTNWNVLVPFESGVLSVDATFRQVHYELHCRRLILFGTGVVCLMSIFILFTPVRQALLAMPIMWLWLVGGNVALGTIRFQSFLARAIESVRSASD